MLLAGFDIAEQGGECSHKRRVAGRTKAVAKPVGKALSVLEDRCVVEAIRFCEDRITDLIADLVRMTLGHGLGREQTQLAHEPQPTVSHSEQSILKGETGITTEARSARQQLRAAA